MLRAFNIVALIRVFGFLIYEYVVTVAAGQFTVTVSRSLCSLVTKQCVITT